MPLKCLWSLSVSRFYCSNFHFGRKKAPNQVFLPIDRSSSRSSLKKVNSRGKCIDVRLFVPRMVILYLKTYVRYGPLLRLQFLAQIWFWFNFDISLLKILSVPQTQLNIVDTGFLFSFQWYEIPDFKNCSTSVIVILCHWNSEVFVNGAVLHICES